VALIYTNENIEQQVVDALRALVSRETVKSQLRSIFQKTGAKRQGELIKLITELSSRLPSHVQTLK
jgi:hypothetical protein